MENRVDRHRLLLQQEQREEQDDQSDHLLEIVDDSFAATCQAVRTNKDVCPFGCGKLLAPRTIDYHRLNGCRGRQHEAFANASGRSRFTCGACFDEFITREDFFEHLNTEHAVQATIREYVFPDFITFERFRFWLEAQGGAHFRQKSGAKIRPSGKGIFMMCNRSGLVHSAAATGDAERDKPGSYRTGFTCSAFINGTIYKDGHVSIRYCGDHYGHDTRVRLPQSVKNIIMHMQNTGRPNTLIVRFLQDHFMPLGPSSIHAQRAAYVDQEELRSLGPLFKRLPTIPLEREEEWEQEFLENAGIVRDWAPEPPERPADWLPIKELAAQKNWAPPLVFKAKVRNSAGDWMVYDERRQAYVMDAPRNVLNMHHYLDDLEELEEHYEMREQHQQQQQQQRKQEKGGGKEAAAGARKKPQDEEEVNVDVEELPESKKETEEEMPQPVASTSAAALAAAATAAAPSSSSTPSSPAAAKKRRLEVHGEKAAAAAAADAAPPPDEKAAWTAEEGELVIVEEVEEEEDEVEQHEEAQEGASTIGVGGIRGDPPATESRSGFLTASIVTELEMIRALVKTESEFLTEADLAAYLRKTRALRLAFEPLSRGGRNAVEQEEFAVPRVTRPTRALSTRVHTRFSQHRQGESRHGLFGGAYPGAWVAAGAAAASSSAVSRLLLPRVSDGSGLVIVDPHDIDVCDEEIVVGAAGARVVGRKAASKPQYAARMWP